MIRWKEAIKSEDFPVKPIDKSKDGGAGLNNEGLQINVKDIEDYDIYGADRDGSVEWTDLVKDDNGNLHFGVSPLKKMPRERLRKFTAFLFNLKRSNNPFTFHLT